MKGLAIASFVLGIIGFLLFFVTVLALATSLMWFGIIVFPYAGFLVLGLLASILAVILGFFPLRKKILRGMAITGMTLGLVCSFLHYGFIRLKPEDIMKQTTKEITQKKQHTETALKLGEGMPGIREEREGKSTETALKLGEGVRIADLLVTLESARIARTHAREYILPYTPKPGYKSVVVKVTCKNVGTKKSAVSIGSNTIEVDKGYIYESRIPWGGVYCNLLPEESYSDDLFFEILESTTPAKLHTRIGGRLFIVDVTLPEEPTKESTEHKKPADQVTKASSTEETTQNIIDKKPKKETTQKGKNNATQTAIRSEKLLREPIRKIQRRNCESPDGNIVYKNVGEGMCPEGSKEVIQSVCFQDRQQLQRCPEDSRDTTGIPR